MKNSGRTAFFIALRYLFSHKKHNIINVISIISVLGIMASTAALIIVLSVFNGLQDLVVNNFNKFNPPLKIEAKDGKVFSLENEHFSISDLEKIHGVKAVELILHDMVLVAYNEKQTLATLYGVSQNYPELSGLKDMNIDGVFETSSSSGVVFGAGIAGLLGIDLNEYTPSKLYYPKRTKKNLANPADAFQTYYAIPTGVFASFTPYDEQVLFASHTLAKELLDYDTEVSFIAVYLDENASLEKVQRKIIQIAGTSFHVKNQIQQEALLFKIIKAENMIVYLILGFIFVIATFNITSVLSMLIIEKKQDISILHTLGASNALVKKVFLMAGTMIGIFGGFIGIGIGLICCLLQQHFQFITFGNSDSSYIINAYPVAVEYNDFAVIFLLIIVISLITSASSLNGLKDRKQKTGSLAQN